MKACKSTPTVEGCGKVKPLAEFQRIHKHLELFDSLCKHCRNKSRRKGGGLKIEPEIYNQFEQLMR